ncbi:MAG: ABC transporter substrate-binding protein [Clostridiales bacterium]|nr:ABC transporter substrate-binding protein [Clostridiales bacterium]
MKKIILLVVSMMLIFSMSGCTGKEPLESIEVKVAGLKGPSSIGMIQMIDQQASLGENVSTTYDIVPAPDTLVAKLLNGEYDFATLPTNTASIIYNKKGEYQLAGIATWGMLYVVVNGVEINDWSDFEGKKVYPFAQGSTPDIIFKYLLEKNGVNAQNVDIDYSLQQAELTQALTAGKVSVAVLPEPFVTAATMQNKNLKIIMNIQEEWKKVHMTSSVIPAEAAYPMTAIVVKKEFAEKFPEVVSNYLKLYETSIDWVNDNPSDAALLIEKHDLGLAAKAAENAIPRSNIRLERTKNCKNKIEFYLNVYNGFSPQAIGGKMPDENFYYGK